MDKLKMHSPDLTQANLARIRELFPGCVTESRGKNGELQLAVDFDLLRQELSDHVVEGPQERYQLDWPGKREALLAANAPIAKTLRPCREESVDFDTTQNLFIEGDNLDALKLLQETYLNQVKLIYIDPPYNTGKDFIYDDDFHETTHEFLERSNQKSAGGSRLIANTETNGRFHSDWISMMYSRLRLSRNLLRPDGVIFASIDDNEGANLKSLLDEVFGPDNFLGQICVISNLKGRSDDKFFATAHNYLLAYSKGAFSTKGVPLPAEYLESYSERDEAGRRYRLQGLRKRGTGARREDRPNMHYPFFVDPTTASISLSRSSTDQVEIMPKLSDGSDGRWRWGRETAFERLSELVAQTVGPEKRWDIFQVDYADVGGDDKRIRPKSVWMGAEFANEAGTLEVKELLGKGIFDTPKPLGLIKYILEQSVDDGEIVLDFFAGSATTAHAVFEFNQEKDIDVRFICVQIPEEIDVTNPAFKHGYKSIADISKERIRRAGKQVKPKDGSMSTKARDIGFRVLKVDSSNMAEVFYAPDAVKQDELPGMINNIKPDRTPEDLLFQVLLDWGVDLSLPIRQETIAGKTVFFVNDDALLACFDTGVDEAFVKQLATYKPLRVVFRDAGFASDAVKINVEQLFKLLSPATDIKTL